MVDPAVIPRMSEASFDDLILRLRGPDREERMRASEEFFRRVYTREAPGYDRCYWVEALRILRSQDDAEDVFGRIIARMVTREHRSADSSDERRRLPTAPDVVKGYLRTMIRREALTIIAERCKPTTRKRSRKAEPDTSGLDGVVHMTAGLTGGRQEPRYVSIDNLADVAALDDWVEQVHARIDVETALEWLKEIDPAKCEVLEACAEGWRPREIAERRGFTREKVYLLIYRARQMLSVVLDNPGVLIIVFVAGDVTARYGR